jgi:hypothetical protein
MADIFISYAREDRDWVEKLAQALQGEGFTVWWDWDLLVGKRYREAIETELSTAKATVVVWSQNSIHSDFVRDEAEEGQQRNILVPVLKEAVRPPAGFRQLQTADLASWNGGAEHAEFRRMMKGVSHLVGHTASNGTDSPQVDAATPTVGPAATPKPEPIVAPASQPKPVAPPAQAKTDAQLGSTDAGTSIPAAFADLGSGKIPPSTHPIWRYVAIGAVAMVAIIYVAVTLFPGKPTAPPHGDGGGGQVVHNGGTSGGQGNGSQGSGSQGNGSQGNGSQTNNGGSHRSGTNDGTPNANGDVAGNAHGATSTNSRRGNGTTGDQVTTPPAAPTVPATPSNGGADVGQTGPHH